MKKITLTLCVLCAFVGNITAQNIGINNTNPQAALDLNGDLRLRSAILTLPANLNHNVDLLAAKSTVYMFAGGALTGCQITGFKGGVDGRVVTIFNNSATNDVQLYDANNPISISNSIDTTRILTGTSNTAVIKSNGTVILRYDGAKQRWTIISSHNTDGLALPATNTSLTSIQGDTSIVGNFTFTTNVTSIFPPINTLPGNVQIMPVLSDDNNSAIFSLPFTFVFDAKPYTHFILTANGFVKFLPNASGTITGSSWTNDFNSTVYFPILAPWWDDLKMYSPDGGVWMLTEGNSPNRIFQIEYICGAYTGGGPNNLRFRVSISETDQSVQYTYFQTADAASVSIGMRSEDLEYSTVNVSTNAASSNTIYQNIAGTPTPGRYYKWQQSPTSFSTIAINSTNALQKFIVQGNIVAGGNLIANNNLIIGGKIENENTIYATPYPAWSGFSTDPFGYYKDKENRVHLSGMVNNVLSGYSTIFKLPNGYIPKYECRFPVLGNNVLGYVIINTAGEINFTGTFGGNVFLDGISFRAN
jgi:hypothetical protein